MRKSRMRNRSSYMRRSTQRGRVSGKIMAIFGVVVLIAGGVLYFLNTGGNFNMSESVVEEPIGGVYEEPVEVECELNDEDICTYINNWQNVRNYTISTTEEFATGEVEESWISIDGESKSRVESSDAEGNELDMITIEDTIYIKDQSDLTWAEVSFDLDQLSQMEAFTNNMKFVDLDKIDGQNGKVVYNFVAKEQCEELSCFKYQVIDPDDPEATQYIWFDDSQYLLRQREYVTTGADGVNSVSYFTYGTAEVTVPSPTKERSPEDFYFEALDEAVEVE